jgi:hypothetical protein
MVKFRFLLLRKDITSSPLKVLGFNRNFAVYSDLHMEHIVAYSPVAKQWLYKQLPLLDNARNIHERNNRRTAFPGQRLGKYVPAVTVTHAT